jgi:pyruvate dehydrogenase E1 component beta subunit
MVERIQAAANELTRANVSVELFDLRIIRPMNLAPIVDSVRKTNRLLLVEENPSAGGWGAEVAAVVTRDAFDFLDAPPERLTLPDWPMPHSPPLEDAAIPSIERIIEISLAMVKGVRD